MAAGLNKWDSKYLIKYCGSESGFILSIMSLIKNRYSTMKIIPNTIGNNVNIPSMILVPEDIQLFFYKAMEKINTTLGMNHYFMNCLN